MFYCHDTVMNKLWLMNRRYFRNISTQVKLHKYYGATDKVRLHLRLHGMYIIKDKEFSCNKDSYPMQRRSTFPYISSLVKLTFLRKSISIISLYTAWNNPRSLCVCLWVKFIWVDSDNFRYCTRFMLIIFRKGSRPLNTSF